MHVQRSEWSEREVEPSRAKLGLVLLRRSPELLLHANFHPQLRQLLTEVKYMQLQHLPVPAGAKAIHEKAEVYRQQVTALQSVCNKYNRVSSIYKHPTSFHGCMNVCMHGVHACMQQHQQQHHHHHPSSSHSSNTNSSGSSDRGAATEQKQQHIMQQQQQE